MVNPTNGCTTNMGCTFKQMIYKKKMKRLLPFCTLIVLSKENENEKEEHWI